MTIASITDSVKKSNFRFWTVWGSQIFRILPTIWFCYWAKQRLVSYCFYEEFPFMVLPLNRIELLQVPQVKDIRLLRRRWIWIHRTVLQFQCIHTSGIYLYTYRWQMVKCGTRHGFYQRLNTSLQLQFNPFPSPHLDSLISIVEDTVAYPILQIPFTRLCRKKTHLFTQAIAFLWIATRWIRIHHNITTDLFIGKGEGYFDTLYPTCYLCQV